MSKHRSIDLMKSAKPADEVTIRCTDPSGGRIMTNRLILSLITTGALACSYSAFAQSVLTGQQRIIEPIIVNGQQAQGALVVQNGKILGYSCPSPQSYVTIDQRESGWACFEETTGMWLLHGQPLQAAT